MSKTLVFLLLMFHSLPFWANVNATIDTDAIWHEFRNNHPYGYQTVGLKHVGDDCVFVISEPSERVSEQSLKELFAEYGSSIDVKENKLGYDGWMKDVVGTVHFADNDSFSSFQKKLFVLLYGTDYKAYYTNLDNPNYHAYYSPYKLNYSVSAAEISKWIIDDKEVFISPDGKETTIPQALAGRVNGAGQLLESRSSGFVAWIICPSDLQEGDKGFLINARKFSIDTDLILGAFGYKGKNVAIIARKRMVPVDILPPLRLETIELLCTTRNKNLAQSYERYHVFAGKTETKNDVVPIYLSDELWNTEYGNLLNVTDQMLKSWSMNGAVDYTNFEYPKPMDWAFDGNVIRELAVSTLTFNWNTSGAGYVIEGDAGLDIFAVNRTGSLPVSYIPEGVEGTDLGNKIFEAEELAYDFFSNLNNPDLTRVVQYATLYQIFCHFRSEKEDDSSMSYSNDDAPSYNAHEAVIEKLLRIVDDQSECDAAIEEGYRRFAVKACKKAAEQLRTLLEEDPYGEFKQFLVDQESEEYINSLFDISSKDKDAATRRKFDSYLEPNLQIVKDYIGSYRDKYKSFPYGQAAHYIVCPRSFKIELENNADWQAYQNAVDKYNNEVDELRRHKEDLSKKIDQFNTAVKRGTATSATRNALSLEQLDVLSEEIALSNKYKVLEKNEQAIKAQLDKTQSLIASTEQSKAIGALNWLLTDPGECNEPIGDFFAHLFKNNGSTWLKCPTIASSWIEGAYGGHNLDAHVTPIKVSAGIPAGKCRVSNVDGRHVISASKQDLRRITPSVLRDIERKNLSGLVDLPELPELRTPNYALSSNGPHFDNNNNFVSNVIPVREKGVVLNDKEYRTMDDVVTDWGSNTKGTIRSHDVRMYEYSEREVSASFDNGPEHVLDRSELFSFELSNYDIERLEMQELADGNVRLTIAQKEETIKAPNCTKASFGIELPREYAEKAKEVLINTYMTLKDKTTNLFRFKKNFENGMQFELKGTMPRFSIDALINETTNTGISIINIEKDEIIFVDAA